MINWDELEGIAVAILHIHPDDFPFITLRQIDNAFRAWHKIEAARSREAWEIARWQTLWLLSPHIKRQKFPSVKTSMRFAWEKQEAPVFTGDADAILAKWDTIPFKA